MCKYVSSCQRCNFAIEIHTEYENMQDLVLDISSDCPNLNSISGTSITLDAMHELIVSKDKSNFMKKMDELSHPRDCTVYESVIDAIGKSLGRYYELA